VSNLMRPCLGVDGVPCGRPTTGSRCPTHAAELGRRRGSPTKRGLGRAYEKRRAPLVGLPCSLRLPGCTDWSDTADHVMPRVDGGSDGPLRPACKHCNSAAGGRLAHRRQFSRG